MSLAVHVSGEALIKVGTGSVGALELLGVSVDGVDIEINDHVEPVYSDTFGPAVPFDEQQMLQTANIHAALVFYDEAILAKIRPALIGVTEGVMPLAGSLIGAGGKYFRTLILSPGDSVPWNFPFTRCTGAKRVKVGTRRNIWDVSWFGVPYTGTVSSSAGAVLYNRTTS